MGRFLAGVGSALALMAAGFFWWQSRSEAEPVLPAAPLARHAALSPEALIAPEPPRATDRTREQKRFDRYDKDRNDIISEEEYLASRRKAFAKLDVNGDGRLSFDEWAAKTREKFGKADADRSRSLTRGEFQTTAPVRKPAPKRVDCPPVTKAPADSEDE